MTPFRRLAVTLHATVVAIFTDTALQLAITAVQTGIGVRANIHLGGQTEFCPNGERKLFAADQTLWGGGRWHVAKVNANH